MALANVLRGGIAAIDSITKDLQIAVDHAAVSRTLGVITYNGAGEMSWDTPVERLVILSLKQDLKRTAEGTEKLSHYKMTMLAPGVTVDLLDKFTRSSDDSLLPPILAIESIFDSAGAAYFHEVWF